MPTAWQFRYIPCAAQKLENTQMPAEGHGAVLASMVEQLQCSPGTVQKQAQSWSEKARIGFWDTLGTDERFVFN